MIFWSSFEGGGGGFSLGHLIHSSSNNSSRVNASGDYRTHTHTQLGLSGLARSRNLLRCSAFSPIVNNVPPEQHCLVRLCTFTYEIAQQRNRHRWGIVRQSNWEKVWHLFSIWCQLLIHALNFRLTLAIWVVKVHVSNFWIQLARTEVKKNPWKWMPTLYCTNLGSPQ